MLLFSCGLQFTGDAITAGPLRAMYALLQLRYRRTETTDERLTDRNASVYIPLYSLVLEQPLHQWIPLKRSIIPYYPHLFYRQIAARYLIPKWQQLTCLLTSSSDKRFVAEGNRGTCIHERLLGVY